MATSLKNLSEYNPNSVPNASELSIGIVVAEWNMDVNTQLLHGAVETLQKHGVQEKNIIVNYVPGSFELTYGARVMAENYDVDAIIVIGTVIQGETPHFTYICQSVSYGITELNLSYDLPFIFGLLTVNTKEQAMDRAGGKYGNKGVEAAVTAIKMALYN
ncbi:MAG: 6,7-dimethyl-8-ribityllumazine synthase [Bacteroidales bacterium]|nr:6,7-dimethyl-8-ribityllumazine synthase [Bacteroidales bacterium]MBQ3677284.1 6,7-dimethyl-8-ribityllumazine synthase [Bacteroidales bacterium]MBR4497216.1 6,7-dimethyl-8-ribityllumazine synthase [Bacteroidales bacterium]MBR4690679.1 6,7-dimethyl-8-ribityllumazine synthase [Bacteroidales bacterium]MBR7035861.1 6,7-dimethyl-8-ribityllumazine synthase [Bacteroidales bacterium]